MQKQKIVELSAVEMAWCRDGQESKELRELLYAKCLPDKFICVRFSCERPLSREATFYVTVEEMELKRGPAHGGTMIGYNRPVF